MFNGWKSIKRINSDNEPISKIPLSILKRAFNDYNYAFGNRINWSTLLFNQYI